MQNPPTVPVVSTIASTPCQGRGCVDTHQALKRKAAYHTGTSKKVMRR